MSKDELQKRAFEIYEKLKPWRGMTFEEARKHGWGEEEDRLQAELWWIGYQILRKE